MKIATKSLVTFAKAHCADYSSAGGCWKTEKLHMDSKPPAASAGVCLLAEGKACKYFCEAVLPARDCPERIRLKYGVVDRTAKIRAARICPGCQAELLPRRRICNKCRRKKTRERVRRHRRKMT